MTERTIMAVVARSDFFITNYIYPTVMLLLGLIVIGLLRLGMRRWVRRKASFRRN